MSKLSGVQHGERIGADTPSPTPAAAGDPGVAEGTSDQAGLDTSHAAGHDPTGSDTSPATTIRIETELFRKAQTGDRGAFGEIVQRYQDRVYNGILRVVGDRDDARDLTQETFTRALVKIDSFRGEAQPYTWLFRIALNLSISLLRKEQRHRTFSLDAAPGDARGNAGSSGGPDQASGLVARLAAGERGGADGSPHEAIERRERHAAVLAALGRVDADYRAVLVMRDVEGFDYQQMADILGLPLGTLKSRLFRARIALRDELKTYFKE